MKESIHISSPRETRSFANTIEAEKVQKNITVITLTQEEKLNSHLGQIVQNKVASDYQKLARPNRIPLEEVTEMLMNDEYESEGRSVTVVALYKSDQQQEEKFAGTLRLVLGQSKNGTQIEPIDAMSLMEARWPHKENGGSDDEISEMGRYTLADEIISDQMQRIGIPSLVTGKMIKKAQAEARKEGKKYLYSIIPNPSPVLKYTQGARIPFREIPETRLKVEDEDAVRIFEKFPRYWNNRRWIKPTLYMFEMNHLWKD